jgi:hypothetical protein
MPIAHFYLPDHNEPRYIPLESAASPSASLTFALGQGAVFATYPKGYIGDITPVPWRGNPDYDQFLLEMRPATNQAAKVHILDITEGESRPSFAMAFTSATEVAAIEDIRTVYIPSQVGAMGINKACTTEVIEFGAIVASVTTEFVESHPDIWRPQ